MKLCFCVAIHTLLFVVMFSSYSSAASAEYLVEDGDVLKINVYDHPDLATIVRVSGMGDINFPLLNKVHVAGLTIPQISEKISKALADGYIINPQVNVFIENFRAQKIYISGEVGKPGAIQYEIDMTLIQAITLAGGFNENAGKNEVEITREVEGKKKVIDNAELNTLIYPGDVIDVPLGRMQDIFVTGAVEKPGVYPYEKGITLIKALTLAGGFTDTANKNKVKIIRKIGGEQESTLDEVHLNSKLQAGDVVDVPQGRMQDIFVTGEVKKPGVYPFEQGITLIKAITLAGGFTDIASKSRIRIIRKVSNGEEITIEKVPLNQNLKAGDVMIVPESFF